MTERDNIPSTSDQLEQIAVAAEATEATEVPASDAAHVVAPEQETQMGEHLEGSGTEAASAASAGALEDLATEAPEVGAPIAKAKPKRRLPRPSVSTLIAVVFLVAGVGIIAYPTFSDWWNSYHQSRAIASYVQAVQETDPAEIERMLSLAEAYNERLLADGNRWVMTDEEKAEYESLLNLTGNGVMGYVQVSSINVDYPIYHGMDEAVLQIAIGHLEGSSLPVGGPNTHAAVTGHRGLPSAKLFTDLDKLREGDTFTITVLNRTVTYEVDQIRIVLPDDLSNLNIEAGQDYATMITCTPYGINTHRMLVRGHRIANIEDADAITADAIQIPRYIAIPAVAVPLLFVFLVGMLIYYRVRRPEVDREQVVNAIKDRISDVDKPE